MYAFFPGGNSIEVVANWSQGKSGNKVSDALGWCNWRKKLDSFGLAFNQAVVTTGNWENYGAC